MIPTRTGAAKADADGSMKGILGDGAKPNASAYFNHGPHSSNFHLDQTKIMDGTLCGVLVWYDNERGVSNRMAHNAPARGNLT